MYEFGEYAFRAAYNNDTGITFSNMNDFDNDLWIVLLIQAVQTPVFILMAWYLGAVLPGYGVRKHWLFFLPQFNKVSENKLSICWLLRPGNYLV